MNKYLVRTNANVDTIYNLSLLGEVKYISSLLNIYLLTTEKSIEKN